MRLFAYEYHVNGSDVIVIDNNIVGADEQFRQHLEERQCTIIIIPTAKVYELAPGILYTNMPMVASPIVGELLPLKVLPLEIYNTDVAEDRPASDILTEIRENLRTMQTKYDRRQVQSNGEENR